MISAILEGTILILIFGLILSHATQFSTALSAVGSTYTGAVKTLAGVAG